MAWLAADPAAAINSYTFGYNFGWNGTGTAKDGGGPTNLGPGFISGNPSTTPWVYNSSHQFQRRVTNSPGLEAGPAANDRSLMVKFDAGINGTLTAIYAGDSAGLPGGTPFLMNMSATGSRFRLLQGWSPNPSRYFGGNGSNVGNEIWQMGMLHAPTASSLNGSYLGTSSSLYLSMRETSAVGGPITPGATTVVTYGDIEVRNLDTTNATSPPPLATVSTNQGFTANNSLSTTQYYFYVFDIVFENTGYIGGNATFNIQTGYQSYLVDSANNTSTLLGNTTLSSANVTSTLNATQLAGMRPALGIHLLDATEVSVTGTTYDYFSTTITSEIIPEPASVVLLGVALAVWTTRRRRARSV